MSYPPPGYYPPAPPVAYVPPAPARLPSRPPAAQTAAAQTVVRGQRPDDPPASERRPAPRPTGLTLPPPEQLGIGARTAAAEMDWNAFHRRLRELGSQSVQSQRTADGYRFVCLLPSTDPSHAQRIEADGATEGEAARLVLDRAEQWARGK